MAVAAAAQVVAGMLTVALVVLAIALVAALWSAWRSVRRRYLRLRSALLGAARPGSASRVMAGIASLPVVDASWWVVQRERHRMWRAVTAAEHAVAAAVAASAPTGDLAALTRRLRRTAESVDAALDACGRSSAGSRPVRRQVSDLIDAAEQLRTASVEALTAVAQPATAGLADAVRVEVEALRHGLATMPAGLRRTTRVS